VAISFILIGNIKVASGIGFFDALIKTVAYYLHEMVWEKADD
jgi:uncharacterized membrane protein